MRPTEQQLRDLRITPRTFDSMVRRGWVDGEGRAKRWYDHQRADHDAQFEEPRERKAGKKKFVKEVR